MTNFGLFTNEKNDVKEWNIELLNMNNFLES